MAQPQFTPEERAQFEAAADEADAGHTVDYLRSRPTIGRPRELGDEAGVVIQFRLDPTRAAQLDTRAAKAHKSRSEIIREALDHELAN